MASIDELSLADKGVGITGCVDALQAFVAKNGRRPSTLTLTKNHAIGVEGIISLAETWLSPVTKTDSDEGNSIESLNIASCSAGREINPKTGANILTNRAMSSLGVNGNRIIHLDLSWNDLNSEAIEGLVRGLLDIKGPGFEAESYDPTTLIPSRTCALESLKLKGNSICDEGVNWLSRLIHDPSSTSKSPPSKLHTLDLYQCAIEENGAQAICECLTLESPLCAKLTSLDLRENDVKSWNISLAQSAIKSSSLDDFCGIKFTQLNENIAKVYAGEVVTFIAGKDVMCHGTLAMLLSLRPYFFPNTSSENPLAHKVIADGAQAFNATAPTIAKGVKATGSIVLDLRGNAMCGFYWEEVEAVEELIELLRACVGGNVDDKNVQLATEHNNGIVGSSVLISAVELDDECGLTDKQMRSIYDACIPPPDTRTSSTTRMVTKIKLNGEEYKPAGWGCSIM